MDSMKMLTNPKNQSGKGRAKKALSLLLALAMTLAIVPCAFAEGEIQVELVEKTTGQYLVMQGDSTDNLKGVYMGASDRTSKTWVLNPIDGADGYYNIINALKTDRANTISINGDGSGGLILWTIKTSDVNDQRWTFEAAAVENDVTYYRIKDVDGKYFKATADSQVTAADSASEASLWAVNVTSGTLNLPVYVAPETPAIVGQTFTYDGVEYEYATDNLVYNGDFSVAATDENGVVTVDGWTAGYESGGQLQDMTTKEYGVEAGNVDTTNNVNRFEYAPAADGVSAYITTPYSLSQWNYSYPHNPADANCFATINNWFRRADDKATDLKAESGKTYLMKLKAKATQTNSTYPFRVHMGAYTFQRSDYATTKVGQYWESDTKTAAAVLTNQIVQGMDLITEANVWTEISAVGTATADGYFSFQAAFTNDYGRASFTDFEIYEIKRAAAPVTVTVSYNLEDSTNVFTEAPTAYVGDSFTPSARSGRAIPYGNALYDVISEVPTITVAESDNVINITVKKKYNVTEAGNLAADADFENGNYLGHNTTNFKIVQGNNGIGNYVLEHQLLANDYSSRANDGVGGNRSFQYRVPVEAGKTYYYSIDAYVSNYNGTGEANHGIWSSFAFTGDTRLYHTGNTMPLPDGTELYINGRYGETKSNILADRSDDAQPANPIQPVIAAGKGWKTISGVVTADENSKYFEFDAYYLCDERGSKFDNLMFYEIAAGDLAPVTIQYNNESGTAIGSKTYNWAAGETIRVLNDVPETLVIGTDGKPYVLNETKAEEKYTAPYTVTASETISYTYKEVDYTVADKTAEVRIGAGRPVLPAGETVALMSGETEVGTADVTFEWETADFSNVKVGDVVAVAGKVLLNGIDTGKTVTANVTITAAADSNLTHYYSFDGDYNDKIGEAHGTAANYGNINVNNGIANIGDSYITLPQGLMTGYTEFTISAYYNTTTFQSWSRIFDFGNGGSGDLFVSATNGTNGKPRLQAGTATVDSGWKDTLGQWYHIVVTGDKDGNVTLYRDNNTKWMTISNVDYTTIFNDTANYYIGHSNWSDDWYYNGHIDDFKIYSVALTADEVNTLMSEAKPYEKYNVSGATSLTAAGAEAAGIAVDDLGIGVKVAQSGTAAAASYGFDVRAVGAASSASQSADADGNGAIFTDNSNVVFEITPWIECDGVKILGAAVKTSLYEEVIKDLAAVEYQAEGFAVNEARLAKYNEVIANGGIIVTDGAVDSVRASLYLAADNGDGTITLTVNPGYSKLGIGFIYKAGKIYIGSAAAQVEGAADVKYTSLTVDAANSKVTLNDAAGQAIVSFSLEYVDLEFVDETILEEESFNEVSVDFDFDAVM